MNIATVPRLGAALGLSLLLGGAAHPEDWPVYGHDASHSAATSEALPSALASQWTYRTKPPRPAWPPPAKQDFWHRLGELHPLVTYDRAPIPVPSPAKSCRAWIQRPCPKRR